MEITQSGLNAAENQEEELDPVDIEILLQGRNNDCCFA